jgi:Pectinacetylesterase
MWQVNLRRPNLECSEKTSAHATDGHAMPARRIAPALALVALASCASPASSANAVLSKYDLSADPGDGSPGAVCNDGSPGAIYYAAGDPMKWVVYLAGGGWCWDEATCAARFDSSPELMSSTSYAQTLSLGASFRRTPPRAPRPVSPRCGWLTAPRTPSRGRPRTARVTGSSEART